ncbi:MAG: DUF418 domain-containing protein [Spirosomataceae bacterium]
MTNLFSASSADGTVTRTERIPTFDSLLGVALLGILLVNIQTFALPKTAVQQLIRGPHGGNYWVLTLMNTVFGNNMQALLTMLFGAAILLFLSKPKRTQGLTVPEQFVRRQLWLILFGLINAIVLLWHYDLLFPYGIVGILLFPFHRLSVRALLICALVAALIFSGKNYWNFTEWQQKYTKYQKVVAVEKKNKKNKKFKLSDEQKEDKSAWEGLEKGSKYDKKAEEAEIKAMRSDYAKVWNHLLPQTQQREASWLYRLGLWEIASLMLLGMALFRWGFFSNILSAKMYAGVAAGGLVVGQTLAWLSLPSYELQIVDITKYVRGGLPLYDLLLPFQRSLTALGWAGLILLLYRLGTMRWLWQALSAVGQMGLTNYILQSLIGTLLFYGYGMSHFGSLKLYQLYFIVAEIWLVQTVFSVVWLRSFYYGPAEWLWRSLTYGKRQPMRLSEPTEETATLLS